MLFRPLVSHAMHHSITHSSVIKPFRSGGKPYAPVDIDGIASFYAPILLDVSRML